MDNLLEAMEQYMVAPKNHSTSKYVKMMDGVMDALNKMESFTDNIPDQNKKNVMKRNITMAQSLLIDNMELYNEWLNKQEMK